MALLRIVDQGAAAYYEIMKTVLCCEHWECLWGYEHYLVLCIVGIFEIILDNVLMGAI
jgi:hypothetical protein